MRDREPSPTLAHLVDAGMLTAEAADWLLAELARGAHVLIGGAAGTGKSAVLAALVSALDTPAGAPPVRAPEAGGTAPRAAPIAGAVPVPVSAVSGKHERFVSIAAPGLPATVDNVLFSVPSALAMAGWGVREALAAAVQMRPSRLVIEDVLSADLVALLDILVSTAEAEPEEGGAALWTVRTSSLGALLRATPASVLAVVQPIAVQLASDSGGQRQVATLSQVVARSDSGGVLLDVFSSEGAVRA